MQMTGYVLMCWGGPYPLFVFAYVLNGFGLGLEVRCFKSIPRFECESFLSRMFRHPNNSLFGSTR